MDPQTRRVLARISARLPEHLKEGLLRTETDDQEAALVEHALSSRHIDDDAKSRLRRLKAKGAFKPISEEVTDENVEHEIDTYYARAIASAIASGELKPAGKDDPWYKKREEKIINATNPV